MKSATVIKMPCQLGLHARVAARFILFVKRFHSKVRIRKGSLEVNGKSILGLLLLGASWNSRLHIKAEGDDADSAIAQIELYFLTPEHCGDHVANLETR